MALDIFVGAEDGSGIRADKLAALRRRQPAEELADLQAGGDDCGDFDAHDVDPKRANAGAARAGGSPVKPSVFIAIIKQ